MFRSHPKSEPSLPFSIGRIGRFINRLKKDTRGVAALEFAWVAPAMLALYMGSLELHYALSADRRVTELANASADLVSQTADVGNEMSDIFTAASAYLTPFGIGTLKVSVTSICHDKNDKGRVDWSAHHANGGVSSYSHGDEIALPSDDGGDPLLTIKGGSLLLAEVEYTYTSPLATFVKDLKLSDRYYVKPRLTEAPSVINTIAGGSDDGCNASEFMSD